MSWEWSQLQPNFVSTVGTLYEWYQRVSIGIKFVNALYFVHTCELRVFILALSMFIQLAWFVRNIHTATLHVVQSLSQRWSYSF